MSIRQVNSGRQSRGFTIIEAMIALALGALVLAGIATMFSQTASVNQVQNGLARLQENGRFAMGRLTEDLQMAGAQYCSTFANLYPEEGQHQRRPVEILATDAALTANGWPTRPAAIPGTSPLPLDPRFFMSGHECNAASDCDPVLSAVAADPGVPAQGTSAGDRTPGSDVLTVRYLVSAGVTVDADVGGAAAVQLPSDPTSPPLSFSNGDFAMISDCAKSEIFVTDPVGNTLTHTTGNGNVTGNLRNYQRSTDARVFNISQGYRTVSYYLGLKDDPNVAGRLISSLWRLENGVAQEMIEGVERLDFMYGVENGDGNVAFLTADEVETAAGGTLTCPPDPAGVTSGPDCLWRAVKSVEVAMLVNSVTDVATDDEPFVYRVDSYTEQYPSAGVIPGVSTTDLEPGRMLRREFRKLISMRNYNH